MGNAYSTNEHLFVIPDGDRYILYAPLDGHIMAVNRAMVGLLTDVNAGRVDILKTHPGLAAHFISKGILTLSDAAPSLPRTGVTEFNPQGVSLFLTTTCSMRCIYCYSSGGAQSMRMPWRIAKAALDHVIDHNVATHNDSIFVSFHGGGEVTTAFGLMKRCVHYVRENAKKNKLRVNIESGLNGIMSQSVVDWIVRHIDGATLSLDGIPEVQNFQRPLANGGRSFPLVAATLRRLDRHHFNYAIRMTVTQKMVANLCESVQFIVDRFRVNSIQVEPVFLFGRALDRSLEPVEVDRFVEQFRAAATIADNNGVRLKYSGARFGTKTSAFCKAVTGDAFGVTPEGDVSSCYEVTDVNDPRSSLFFVGNFDRAHGAFVFKKEKIERLRSLTVEHKACCSKCFCKWHCAGDCPAKLAAMGNAWRPDLQSRCRITMDLTKDQIKKML